MGNDVSVNIVNQLTRGQLIEYTEYNNMKKLAH